MHLVNAKGILSAQNGMNIYRGCTHGCIYCDSRSDCYNMNHKFEDIEVKQNAPELLLEALLKKRTKCMIGTGSMCDSYMPLESSLCLTRRCLKIIESLNFGVAIQTKSDSILRDLDLLRSINEKAKCVVEMTLTTYNEDLCRKIEPCVSTTNERFEALKIFAENKIPTVVWISPLLPFINDDEENLRGILNYCFEAKVKGIICFGIGTTMRSGSREYFYESLDRCFPGIKQKYIQKFGYSYECTSENNGYLMEIFHDECEKHGVMHDISLIFKYMQSFPEERLCSQLSFF